MSKFSIGDSVKLKGRENVQTVIKVTITKDGEFVKLCGCSVNFKAEDIEKVESKTDCKFKVGDKVAALINMKDEGECYFKKGEEAEIEFIFEDGFLKFENIRTWSFNPTYFEKVNNENDCEFKIGDKITLKNDSEKCEYIVSEVLEDGRIAFDGNRWKMDSSRFEKVENKTFKLNYIDLDVTIAEQIDKLQEETKEVVDAVINRDTENILEESMDVIQVVLGLIQELGLQKEFIEYNNKRHYEKLLSKEYKLTDINNFK